MPVRQLHVYYDYITRKNQCQRNNYEKVINYKQYV